MVVSQSEGAIPNSPKHVCGVILFPGRCAPQAKAPSQINDWGQRQARLVDHSLVFTQTQKIIIAITPKATKTAVVDSTKGAPDQLTN